ncbi:phage tail sheath family protein [Agromyces aurantiacus]|uniref:Phage tail sheath family protein n=1 Tax=Agromyces aurantiacus TaxID=165814 RepID=A0ABV9RAG4_9MICO|nr:DUF2586 family protein [Agromyces aurantiacus]MBM7503836.1 phage tail sheath protein FI [Agromyces aurantiacus]
MTRPIEGVGTAVAAFIGFAETGPLLEPTLVESLAEFEAAFGADSGTLRGAIDDFFANGGSTAIVVRVEDAGLHGVGTGLEALDRVDLVNLVVLPAESVDRDDANAVVAAAAAFGERRRTMLLVDPPSSWTNAAAIEAAMAGGAAQAVGTASPNAAVYAPRLRRAADGRLTAATGAVAGVLARTDASRGVWASPAGLEAALVGVDDLAFALRDDETRRLAALGVNALRRFPGHGPVVWGARTLAGADASASEWRYVPVRRTALFLEESIDRGLRWTRFEPNDEPLWREVRESVGAFLHDLFRAGAFPGTTPRDAYVVRCDRDTATQRQLEGGEFTVLVGFAPLRPGEFVVLRVRARALPTA